MSLLECIDKPFIVLDAWQMLGFAEHTLQKLAAAWVVIFRRHEEGVKWYLLTRIEFEAKVKGKSINLSVEDALQLREHMASEVFYDEAPTKSARVVKALALNSPNRAVVLDSLTGTVKSIASLVQQDPDTGVVPHRVRVLVKKSAASRGAGARMPRRAIAVAGPAEQRQRAGIAVSIAAPAERLPTTSHAFTLVPVYFGTDRKPTTDNGKPGFGDKREPDGKVNLGRCHVTIPASYSTGELESPKWYRLEFKRDPKKHLTIWDTAALEPNAFYRDLRKQIQGSSEKSAFVFVHGFNVTFEDAAYRTGQMAYDLGFNGGAILFSWPSRGTLKDYFPDEATVDSSMRHFQYFLGDILSRSGAEIVHIIAHSMGNRVLLGALEKLVGAGEPTKIQNVILAAPDLDKLEFKEVVEIIHNIPRRLTLYASAKDKALQASMALHRYPRAGEAGGNLVTLPCLDAIDASDVDTDFLGHSLALTDRFVLGDVFELLRRGTAPDGRFGLQRIDHGVTGPHWAFRS